MPNARSSSIKVKVSITPLWWATARRTEEGIARMSRVAVGICNEFPIYEVTYGPEKVEVSSYLPADVTVATVGAYEEKLRAFIESVE